MDILRSGKRHRNVLESEGYRRETMKLQLIQCDKGLVAQDLWIHPHSFTERKTARRVSGWGTPPVSLFDAEVSLGLIATTLSRTKDSSGRVAKADEIALSMDRS